MRILVLIAIGLLLYVIIVNLLRKSRSESMVPKSEEMVRCSHCGLHILEQEALKLDNDYYCSKEHSESHK